MVPAAICAPLLSPARGPGPPGAGPRARVHRPWRGHRRRRGGRRGVGPGGARVRPRGAVDDRRHPVPPGPLRLLPSLCRTGHELASANMVRGLLDSAATLVGPLLAAVLLRFTSVAVVFAVAAAASLWAAALLLRLRYDAPPRPPPRAARPWSGRRSRGCVPSPANRGLALILGLAAAQSLTRGALTVLSVVVAIELLGTGEPGVGALMTAVGVGAVVGSLAASLLVGTSRLGAWFAAGRRRSGAADRADRRRPGAAARAGPARLRRRRQRPDRRQRLHPARPDGPRRGAGAGLRACWRAWSPCPSAWVPSSRRSLTELFGARTALIGDRAGVPGPRRGVVAAAAAARRVRGGPGPRDRAAAAGADAADPAAARRSSSSPAAWSPSPCRRGRWCSTRATWATATT